MKKMTVSLVVLLALCMVVPASTQVNVGVLGGLNLATVELDPEPPKMDLSNLTGFGFGGVLDYRLNESIALRLEPMYLQKGTKGDYDWGNAMIELEAKYAYVEIPIMVKYSFGAREIKPYIIAGPTIGFLLNAKAKYSLEGESWEEDINDMKSLDFGFGFGIGVSVPLRNNSFFLEASYVLGLANIADEQDNPYEEI